MDQAQMLVDRAIADAAPADEQPAETPAELEPTADQATVLPDFSSELNMDPVAELDLQVRKASFFVQASLEKHGKLAHRLDAYLTGLLDVLIETGVVEPAKLGEIVNRNREQQAREQADQLAENGGLNAWPLVLVRDEKPDDPTEPETPVDCSARMHICKAICCSLRFPLGPSEIEAGKVKFEIGHPYVIRHSDKGYCVHNDRETGRCSVYEDRPQVCRAYSCASDTRIWKDFDKMILNEQYLSTRVPQRFFFKPETNGAVPVSFTKRADGETEIVVHHNGNGVAANGNGSAIGVDESNGASS